MCGAATAQSYQFSYKGHTLKPAKGNFYPVPNATYVTASFSVPASVMPAPGQCAYNLVPSLNYVADGNFNSVSLPAQGYIVEESFGVCLDSTGKKITGASFVYLAYLPDTNPIERYEVNTDNMTAKGNVDIVVSCQCYNGYYREDIGRSGKWTLKKID